MSNICRTAVSRGHFRSRRQRSAPCGDPGRLPLGAPPLPRVDVHRGTDSGPALLHSLRCFGYVVLTATAESAEVMARCYDAAARFFSLPLEAKARHGAGDGVGQAHGYMSYLEDAEGSECFEAKAHHDQAFVWPATPASFRASIGNALDLLRSTTVTALRAILAALGQSVDPLQVLALLDVDGAGPIDTDLATCSHTAMRVWSYTEGRVSGWHCDNTLLTLGPVGSSPGLQIRTLDGHECFPEGSMAPGEAILFAGDALSYITAGVVPALMHRVVPSGNRSGSPARLSAPFFLRGKRGAQLRPPSPLPPLSVALLERNPGNLRSAWPWKQGEQTGNYYRGTVWHAAHAHAHAPECTV